MMKRYGAVIGMVLLVALAGCAHHNDVAGLSNMFNNAAGFWPGLWHGLCAPVSLIGSLLSKKIGVYEVGNAGFRYDLGFLLGVLGWGAAVGCATTARKN